MNKMINQRDHTEALLDNLVLTSLKKQRETRELPIVKSPLRYPGGKSRAVPMIINNYIRKRKTVCSPFVGGGSIELTLAKRGTRVYAYDAFKPLVIFWQMLLKDASALAEKVREYEDMTSVMFYNLQKTFWNIKNQLEIAAVFFVLNRSSFSGTTLSGGMSPGHPRFNYRSIERLKDFKIENFTVEHRDFTESIPKHFNDFLYCDPPYLINQKLYGHKGDKHNSFDHQALAELLRKRQGWVLSYNDCVEVRELYKGHTILNPEWTYGMGNNKKSNELVILSKDL
ncbi:MULTISPECIES: DNA adenine methylase [unclassified Bartonella]